MTQKIILFITSALLFIALGAGGTYYFLSQKEKVSEPTVSQTPSPVSTATITPSPTYTPTSTNEGKSNIPAGWLTYKNAKYGFEISYPKTYKALDDKENLYGWPNGIVLIYKGGQSYDLAIEHWNTKAEYEAKYKNQSNLTVKQVENVFITMLNTNQDSEVDQIIKTFKATE